MRCPHCSQEVKPKGPDCSKCGQRIFGSGGALDDAAEGRSTAVASDAVAEGAPDIVRVAQAMAGHDDDNLDADVALPTSTRPKAPAGPDTAAPPVEGLAVDVVKDLDVDVSIDLDADDAFDQAVTAVRVEEEESGRAATAAPDLGYDQLDLDGDTIADHAARAERGRETLETGGSVALRRELVARDEAASRLYDESLMGGLYLGALIGGFLGYMKARSEDGWWMWTLGGAVVCALIGLVVGLAAGKGASSGVRTERGQTFLIGLGLVLIAAPLIGVLVRTVGWGYTSHTFWAACTHFVVAFGIGALTFQDARRRQADGAVFWGVLVGVLPPLYGLYASRRPHGELVPCGGVKCGMMYLSILPECPHCGFVSAAGRRDEVVEI